jgi:hypothetical protein
LEEFIASIFIVEEQAKEDTNRRWEMEAISSSQTLPFHRLTWRFNPEHHNFHSDRCKNLRFDRPLLADASIGRIIATYSPRLQCSVDALLL